VPLDIARLAAHERVSAEYVGLGLAVVAIALLVHGCARVDPALRRPALAAAAVLAIVIALGTAAMALQHHPIVLEIGSGHVAAVLALVSIAALVMTVRLLGRSVRIAEARSYGERVRAAQLKAKQAQLVHERWRAARLRS
jgi:hypothetical protein